MEIKSNNTANTANNSETIARMKHRRFTETKIPSNVIEQQQRLREIFIAQESANSADDHNEIQQSQGNIKNNGAGSSSKLSQYGQIFVGGQHEKLLQQLPENSNKKIEKASKIYMNQKPRRQEGRSGQRTSNLKVTSIDQRQPDSKLSGYNTTETVNTNIMNDLSSL